MNFAREPENISQVVENILVPAWLAQKEVSDISERALPLSDEEIDSAVENVIQLQQSKQIGSLTDRNEAFAKSLAKKEPKKIVLINQFTVLQVWCENSEDDTLFLNGGGLEKLNYHYVKVKIWINEQMIGVVQGDSLNFIVSL